jgi:hypothetical protein
MPKSAEASRVGYNDAMRFRAGVVTGFAVGFYLGALAGRERFHQINRMLRQARRSDALGAVTGRAKAVVGVGRAEETPGDRFAGNPGPGPIPMSGPRLAPAWPAT